MSKSDVIFEMNQDYMMRPKGCVVWTEYDRGIELKNKVCTLCPCKPESLYHLERCLYYSPEAKEEEGNVE